MLERWILLYNANRELKDYNLKQEVYMADARRKTTMEEHKEIVKYGMSQTVPFGLPICQIGNGLYHIPCRCHICVCRNDINLLITV